jgi:hypothetical protein
MNEGDAIEAVAAAATVCFTCFTIYISVTFGFLATAYFVGNKLTRFQVISAMGLYVVAAGWMALATIGWGQAVFAITEAKATALDTVALIHRGYWIETLSILLGIGMIISLCFMWGARHPKTA